MDDLQGFINRHALIVFFVLAYILRGCLRLHSNSIFPWVARRRGLCSALQWKERTLDFIPHRKMADWLAVVCVIGITKFESGRDGLEYPPGRVGADIGSRPSIS
jgi:hypothetical protein